MTDACTQVSTAVPDFAFGIGKVVAHHVKQQCNRWKKSTRVEYNAEGKRAGTEQIWEKIIPQGERFPNKPGTKHPRSMIIRLPLRFDTHLNSLPTSSRWSIKHLSWICSARESAFMPPHPCQTGWWHLPNNLCSRSDVPGCRDHGFGSPFGFGWIFFSFFLYLRSVSAQKLLWSHQNVQSRWRTRRWSRKDSLPIR